MIRVIQNGDMVEIIEDAEVGLEAVNTPHPSAKEWKRLLELRQLLIDAGLIKDVPITGKPPAEDTPPDPNPTTDS